MKLIMIVPRVVRKYLDQFPDTQNEAYKYFNYDNRIIDERMNRGDARNAYKGPDDFTDGDYDSLVANARTLINPILQKYSHKVACEDALETAIRSFGGGQFDGKVNACRYAVLLDSMMSVRPVSAKKKGAPKAEKPAPIPGRLLKQLGVAPRDVKRRPGRGMHQLVKYPGGDVVIQKSAK